ncbi:hypothetical protein [Bradyrhizobium iriomotense]|uniref:Uncharacterized protein n=1 Tax=Bradyrhizobium iriomotense TaxID=441950 RepID=A0ABQ6B8U4_9BRAD|nr:hypothetical protein [Bradyrhizobium iriomotense]GLR90800.1 hypothetical protein GCM10007857_75160 [Bradyrhizobium iriomotense]
MAEPFSRETQDLFDASDRAIAKSRELVDQRREMIAECERNRREQEARFTLRRAIWNSK